MNENKYTTRLLVLTHKNLSLPSYRQQNCFLSDKLIKNWYYISIVHHFFLCSGRFKKHKELKTNETMESKPKFVLFPKISNTTKYVQQSHTHDRLKVLKLYGLSGTLTLMSRALHGTALVCVSVPSCVLFVLRCSVIKKMNQRGAR